MSVNDDATTDVDKPVECAVIILFDRIAKEKVTIYVLADSLVRRDARRWHPATEAVNQEVSEHGCSLVNNYRKSKFWRSSIGVRMLSLSDQRRASPNPLENNFKKLLTRCVG